MQPAVSWQINLNTVLSKSFFFQSIQTLGAIMFIMLIGLIIDSKYVAVNYFKDAQWINNILVVFLFIWVYHQSPKRSRELLIYAALIAIVGEYTFSKLLGMYTYRLDNIPHYIPFGHGIVFIFIYNFSKKSEVKNRRKAIEKVFTISIFFAAFFFLIFKNDWFGFLLTLLVFFFLRNYPKEKLFYLTMFVFVLYTEVVGTFLECWKWPPIAFGKFSFLPSANPPIGICFFYFGLDRGTMSIYKRKHKEAWARLKRIRAITA